MLVAGLDVETTGKLDPNHKIIELCVQKWDASDISSPTLLETKVWRFNPERSIEPKAYEVHKIAAADLVGEPYFRESADDILRSLNDVQMIVAHNGHEFDKPFVRMELEAAGKVLGGFDSIKWFDTMVEGRWACPWGKVPSLRELCWACDVEYDPEKAHAAEYDVNKMMQCYFFGRRTGFFAIA